ncbi:MAG: hypothetical protein ABL878_10760 [Burkholderiales bacterium]
MLDPDHLLVKLAGPIGGSRFDAALGRFYTPLKARTPAATAITETCPD